MSATDGQRSAPAASRWASRVVLGAVVLVIGALLFVVSPWFSAWVARAVETAASAAIGENVLIGDLSIQPGRARVQVDGVVISHRSDDPDRDGQAIVVAERITADLGWSGWRPTLQRLSLERPVVHLHIDPDGLREFRGISPRDGAPPERFPWEELWIRDGRFRLTAGDLVVDTAGISAKPSRLPGRVHLGIDDLRLQVRGWVQAAEPVRLTDVEVSPRHIDVPALDLRLPVASISGGARLEFGGPVAGSVTVEARLAALTGLLPAHIRLEGLATVEVDLAGEMPTPLLVGAALIEDAAVYRMRSDGEVLLVEVPRLSAGLRFDDRLLTVDPVRATWSGGDVQANATFDLSSMALTATLLAEGVSLKRAFQRTGVSDAPWVELDTDAEIHVAGTVQPLFLAGTAALAGRNLAVAGGPVERSERILSIPRLSTLAELHIKDQRLAILARRLETPRSFGTAFADLDLGPNRSMVIDIDLPQLDLSELRPLADLDLVGDVSASGRLYGPMTELALEADVRARDLGMLGFPIATELAGPLVAPRLQLLQFTDLSGRLGSSGLRGRVDIDLGASPTDLDLQVLLRNGRVRDLVQIFVDVEGLDGDAEGTLTVQGPTDALDGELSLELGPGEIFGEHYEMGQVSAIMDDRRITLDRVQVRRGDEGAMLRGTLEEDGRLELDVQTSDLSLTGLDALGSVDARLQGRLRLSGRVAGTLEQPLPEGRLVLRDALLGGRSLGDSRIDFDTTGDTLGFSGVVGGPELDVAGTLQLGGEGAWAIQADLDAFPAHAFYPATPDGTPLDARVTGQVVAVGELGIEGQPFDLRATTSAVDLQWSRHRLQSTGPWSLWWSDHGFSVADVELTGGATRVHFGGSRGDGGQLSLVGGGDLDLDLLRAFVPGLERSSGLGHIAVTAEGVRGALVPVVSAEIDQGRFDATWLPEPIEAAEASLRARSDRFEVVEVSGRLGGGALTGGGVIDADGWLPVRYDLWMRLADARVAYFDWLPPVTGDASLTFVGPASDPLLSGRVDVRDMLFADRIDWEDAVVDLAGERLVGATAAETDDLFSMDVQMVSNRTIRVRNNLGDLVASGDLRLVGDTARPGLVGGIRAVPGGRVYLKEREFELVRGELHFVEPYAFDPELDIALATEVRTREDDYAIDYRISGPWSDWRADSSSDPSLPQADINALLLFGMTRAELERYGGAFSALALEGGDLLASKFGLVETLGQGIYGLEILRPERIDLVSGITERGSGSISSELRILAEKDLDWATLILEQNVSRLSDTYVGLERRLANRLYVRGFWARQQVGRQVSIGGAWGLDFNLRWEVD